MRIDIHAHVKPPGVEEREEEVFPRPGRKHSDIEKMKFFDPAKTGTRRDAAKRVETLDALEIDHMIVSAGPPTYMYWLESKVAVPLIAFRNEAFARYCDPFPTRLSWFATIPGQDIPASIEEIDHALELGAVGIQIGADNIGGRELDDQAFWPLYEKVQRHRLPLFIHPYPMGTATNAPDPYHLSWGPGYAYQETLAFARLTLGGALDDFPGLKIHITHGCGFVPYQMGRLDITFAMEPDVRAKKPPREYLDNFFFDLQLHDAEARRFAYEWAGPDRLVIGDNFGGWDATDGFKLLDEMDIPIEHRRKIEGDNAATIFNLLPRLDSSRPT